MPVKEFSGPKLVIRLPDRDTLNAAAKKYLAAHTPIGDFYS